MHAACVDCYPVMAVDVRALLFVSLSQFIGVYTLVSF